jgi:HD-like signal output (HDOD) protein
MTTRINVLFVDDDPMVLRGLRRQMESLTTEADHHWLDGIYYVESGAEALAVMARHPCDIIISDMRMPGMDGAALLAEVKKNYPHTVRIVLSGFTDRGADVLMSGLAHQYLAKPCDFAQLAVILNRVRLLRGLLNNDGLKKLIAQMKTVPSLPKSYYQLMTELQSPKSSVKQVGAIIGRDSGMAAKIMQLVNSAYFGLPHPVFDPVQAVLLLGLDTVRTLVISVHVFSQFEQTNLGGLSLDTLQAHHLTVGSFARRIAQAHAAEKTEVESAFTAGLLHDLGKLVLAANLPGQYKWVLEMAQKRNLTPFEAEQRIFAATHAQVGAYLAGLWGLPQSIVYALAYHHHPSTALSWDFTPITAVHLANAWAYEVIPACPNCPPPGLDLAYLAEVGVTPRLDDWKAACQTLVDQHEVS